MLTRKEKTKTAKIQIWVTQKGETDGRFCASRRRSVIKCFLGGGMIFVILIRGQRVFGKGEVGG